MATKSGYLPIKRLVIIAVLLSLLGGVMYYQVIGSDFSNPRANFWRMVREGVPAYTSTPAQGHTILIQNGGENWRGIRNGFIMPFSQWIILIAVVAIGLIYKFIGPDRLEEPRSGIVVKRHAWFDRILHWYTAILFISMALTGLSMLLGRLFLIPVIGLKADSVLLQSAKVLHNYFGPLLFMGIILEFIFWIGFNIPQKVDLEWIKKMTGQLKGHIHIGKVNAGQKAWFWSVVGFGAVVGVTGVILDFPIWEQSRITMQVSHIIHVIAAILFVGAALGHIYLGSIGTEGTFEGMWKGTVDKVWAKQHSDLWYEEIIKKEEQGRKTVSSA